MFNALALFKKNINDSTQLLALFEFLNMNLAVDPKNWAMC